MSQNVSNQIDLDYYLFDNPTVQNVLFVLYTIVFIFCFFGNLTVVLVMAFHWRMQSITKYCIGNLAFANMCVGVFCVYQNFTLFIMGSWPFGDFLCKMFHFVNSLSHTASILILVVISVERYFVILHPFKCRRVLTIKRLRFIMLGVWIISGLLCLPRLMYVILIPNPQYTKEGEVSYDVICSIGSHLFASETMEMIQFLLLFILPLLIISILYYKIGIFLHQREAFSEAFVSTSLFEDENNKEPHERSTLSQLFIDYPPNKRELSPSQVAQINEKLLQARFSKWKFPFPWKKRNSLTSHSFQVQRQIKCRNCKKHSYLHKKKRTECCSKLGSNNNHSFKSKLTFKKCQKNLKDSHFRSVSLRSLPSSSQSHLVRINFSGSAVCCEDCGFFCSHSKLTSPHRSHKNVVKLLITIVITFVFCNLPYHLRKIYQNYFYSPDNESDFDELATPVTFLLMYANCAINPIVYAFLSKNFRTCLMDVLRFNCKKTTSFV